MAARDRKGMRLLLRIQTQQLARRCCGAEHAEQRLRMKVALERRLKHRQTHPPLDLVAGHHRGYDLPAGGTQLLTQSQYRGIDDDSGVGAAPGSVMLEFAAIAEG